MRILITGASGQVGGALTSRLTDHELITPDRSRFDLAQPSSLSSILDEIRPDLIINPAAYTAVDLAESERELARRVNADAPGVMARWAADNNIPLVHFSTDYVFDGSGHRPWSEGDEARPLSAYGQSKLEGEEAVRAAGGPALVVRTSWVYAARGKNFLRTIVRLAQQRQELRIVADQIGAPTSAAFIADALARILAEAPDDFRRRREQCGGVLNVAAAGETSWYGFACAIVEGLKGRHVPVAVKEIAAIESGEYPTPARRPQNSRLDLSKLRAVFEIVPAHWLSALQPELDRLAAELGAANSSRAIGE